MRQRINKVYKNIACATPENLQDPEDNYVICHFTELFWRVSSYLNVATWVQYFTHLDFKCITWQQNERLFTGRHRSAFFSPTGYVLPLRGDWAIFCHAGTVQVARVWSASEKSLKILRHSWELNPGHGKDRRWDSFLFPLSCSAGQINNGKDWNSQYTTGKACFHTSDTGFIIGIGFLRRNLTANGEETHRWLGGRKVWWAPWIILGYRGKARYVIHSIVHTKTLGTVKSWRSTCIGTILAYGTPSWKWVM